jgi:hypothetical protein
MKFLQFAGAGAIARLVATLWSGYVAAAILGYYTGIWRFQRHHVESAWVILVALCALTVFLLRRAVADSLRGPGASAQGASRQEAPPGLKRRGRSDAGIALLGVLVSFALHHRALFLGLFSDDFVLLARAREGAYTDAHAEFLRPVTLLIWSVVAHTSNTALWLHVFNIALHGLNGALVALLAERWGLPRRWALGAALAFLAFPAHVEAVVWPSGMQDVLMTTFGLGFVLLVSAPTSTLPLLRVGAGLCLLALALLTKETAVALPLLCALALFLARRAAADADVGTSTWHRWGVVAASLLLAGGFAVWRVSSLPNGPDNLPILSSLGLKDFIVRPLAALGAPWTTADLAAWPVVGVLAGWIVLALLVAALWRRGSAMMAVIVATPLWILLSAAPVGRYFFVGADLDGSRYLYLPAVGWAIGLVSLARVATGAASSSTSGDASGWGSRAPVAACVLLVGIGAAMTVGHIGAWGRAAAERDRLLMEVASVVQRERCDAVAVHPLPDAIDGVYVFRNGFAEALRERGVVARVGRIDDTPERCRVGQ